MLASSAAGLEDSIVNVRSLPPKDVALDVFVSEHALRIHVLEELDKVIELRV